MSSSKSQHRLGKRVVGNDKSQKSKEGSSKQNKAIYRPHLSFLFVVNELNVVDEENGLSPNADRFANPLPPNVSKGYGTETVGNVWRYRDGAVTQAEDFCWHRSALGCKGSIWGSIQYLDENGTPYWVMGPLTMEEYQTYSVFNCWRFLPCLYADVDVSTVPEMEIDNRWFHLEFSPDQYQPGLTRIRGCGGSQRHVAGSRPSWMPSLLPETYAAPSSANPPAPQSTGLGGSFPIIMGLLTLTRSPGQTDEAFRIWRGCWRPTRAPDADPEPAGPVRGVMVQVYCDIFNPDSTNETISWSENNGNAIISG